MNAGIDQIRVEIWEKKGVNIWYQERIGRKGYKAGALKAGMEQSYAKYSEYIAMFDANFAPGYDFLTRSIHYLVHNTELGLVQGRWKFGMFDYIIHFQFNGNGRFRFFFFK